MRPKNPASVGSSPTFELTRERIRGTRRLSSRRSVHTAMLSVNTDNHHHKAPAWREAHRIKRACVLNRLALAVSIALAFSAGPALALQDQPQEIDLGGPPTEIEMTDRGRVRMHVAGMPLSTVLHLLSLQTNRNIITSPKVKGTVTANLYDVTFDEALHAILVANGARHRIEGNFVYIYTHEELEEIEEANRPTPLTRVYRLNYISSADAQTYLSTIVGENDGAIAVSPVPATGLGSSAEKGGGNASAASDFIVVTARAELHKRIKAVLKQLDIQPLQVLIEATILQAKLTDENALGIDFSLLGGVDLKMLGATSSGLADLSLGPLPESRLDGTSIGAFTDFRSNVSDGGFTLGVIKNNVGMFIRALEGVTDTTILANPKILALNKQKGQVIVGRRDGFITTTVTQTQAIQTVEFLETGTQLIFRPFIGDDGFIRVELHPEVSSGGLDDRGLPFELTTEVTTNILVRDSETILIGGLFREVSDDKRSQVPGLGNLPGIGTLFQSRSDLTEREEIIILLTVHIIKDRAAYASASEQQADNIERMRVGLRQGMMNHGRERVAESHYHAALEAIAEDDETKALWHLNMVLHNNGRHIPAIRMKEKIVGERAWDEDAAGGRTFIRRLISDEKGYAFPADGRSNSPLPRDP